MPTGTYIPSANVPILGQTNDIKISVDNINLHSSNNVYSKNNIVIGTGHNINGSNCFISGSNHTISGDNVLIFGGNAITITDNNLLIFGDDVLFTKSATFKSSIYGLSFENIIVDTNTHNIFFIEPTPATSDVLSGTLSNYIIPKKYMKNYGDSILFSYFLTNSSSTAFSSLDYDFVYGGITFSVSAVAAPLTDLTHIVQGRLYRDGISSFSFQGIIGNTIFATFSGIDYNIDNELKIICRTNIGVGGEAVDANQLVSSIEYIRAPY